MATWEAEIGFWDPLYAVGSINSVPAGRTAGLVRSGRRGGGAEVVSKVGNELMRGPRATASARVAAQDLTWWPHASVNAPVQARVPATEQWAPPSARIRGADSWAARRVSLGGPNCGQAQLGAPFLFPFYFTFLPFPIQIQIPI
jgi:hypothetical protein